MAAVITSSPTPPRLISISTPTTCKNYRPYPRFKRPTTASHVCTPPPPNFIDTCPSSSSSSLLISETTSDAQLWAASCLRVRSFNRFPESILNSQDHKKYLAEREFEALKERVAGKRTGFQSVSCINATIPLSQLSCLSVCDQLSAECKFNDDGEDRVVVGSLDLNQCMRLPDEITGLKPAGMGADFARAYLSNVCVAEELQRNGLGCRIVDKSKQVAMEWGITDLYVHVAIDNEPAKRLYAKSGFVYESDEPAWQARFLDRPRRLLLWLGLPVTLDL